MLLAVARGWFGQPVELLAERSWLPPKDTAPVKKPENFDGKYQKLFGDLHVHTSISLDAYLQSMPLLSGEGIHTVGDACDFARYCSSLDFFSINDHAETITPKLWKKTKEAIRSCNISTQPESPDLVAFLGYEWTQVGDTPEDHYGHKNVVFLETDDDLTPSHPVAAKNPTLSVKNYLPGWLIRVLSPLFDSKNAELYFHFNRYLQELSDTRDCPLGTSYEDLPEDCIAYAETPVQLFEQLDQWGGDSLVIPHGNSWGLYTPRAVTWDKQLKGKMHDEDKQRLVEVYSGHGNSEEYRPWRHAEIDQSGRQLCPERVESFYPGCRRAGDIVYDRCVSAELGQLECEARRVKAQQNFLDSKPHVLDYLSVPGTSLTDWQDSQQCTDCFQPTYRHRPGGSVQYALAIRNFDSEGKAPRRFNFGIIGSSDTHLGRPGTGYKEFDRRYMTDAPGFSNDKLRNLISAAPEPNLPNSRVWEMDSDMARSEFEGLSMEYERAASFFYTGGLVAVVSKSRRREDIWEALKARRVYGTSGERMSLGFELVNNEPNIQMGGEVSMAENPSFKVTAIGDFEQQPGCPQFSTNNLGATRIQSLCRGQCYNPGDKRGLITRIEIIRIRPQNYPGEPVEKLIEDPWKTHQCTPDQAGCEYTFQDDQFERAARDTLYYARAIGEPKMMINGNTQNIRYDEQGQYVGMTSCDSASESDCLAENEPRAWSSPIFVGFGEE